MTRAIQLRDMRESRAGCVQLRDSRSTGTAVGIYRGADAGLCTEGGPWSIVCEEHGAIVACETLKQARTHAPDPRGWCDDCREGQTA